MKIIFCIYSVTFRGTKNVLYREQDCVSDCFKAMKVNVQHTLKLVISNQENFNGHFLKVQHIS